MKYSYYEAVKQLRTLFWQGTISGREYRDAEFLLYWSEE